MAPFVPFIGISLILNDTTALLKQWKDFTRFGI